MVPLSESSCEKLISKAKGSSAAKVEAMINFIESVNKRCLARHLRVVDFTS